MFENQYLTYVEYLSLGGKLEEMPFNLLETKAQKILDEQTFSRLKKIAEIPSEVKICLYDLIDRLDKTNEQTNSNIASENIDGYSVTYKTTTEANAINSLVLSIRTYLHDTIVNGEYIMNRVI